MLFPQTLKETTMIYIDVSGLRMCFSEWRIALKGMAKKI